MEMKKILGILLAVCFLMSVTAAAVSAGGNDKQQGPMGKDSGGRDKGPNGHDGKIGPAVKQSAKHFKKVCYTKTVWKNKLVGFKYIKVHGHKKAIPIFRKVPVHFRVCKTVPVNYGYGHR